MFVCIFLIDKISFFIYTYFSLYIIFYKLHMSYVASIGDMKMWKF